MAANRKNYIDKNGNYHNVENLSLAEIYQHGFYEGKKACYYKGHVHDQYDKGFKDAKTVSVVVHNVNNDIDTIGGSIG